MGTAASVDNSVTVDSELAKVLNMSDGNLAKAAERFKKKIIYLLLNYLLQKNILLFLSI